MTFKGQWATPDADAERPFVAPSVCPFCQSTAVTSSGKQANASSYWRCSTCGELWNVARLQSHPGRVRRGW